VLRTHTCGELTKDNEGEEVTLCGWIETIRDFGQGKFIDVRDRYGLTQIVISPNSNEQVLAAAENLKREYVVQATGKVLPRPTGQENPKLQTGEVEIETTELTILNESKTPPFLPNQEDMPNEDLRLKHRYLDLRRPQMQKSMYLRSKITKSIRDYFEDNGFLDI